jgi:3-hydroxyacyl-CoA dehydrogenase
MQNKVLIIGSGKMGTNLFHYLSGFPVELVWLCLNENEQQKAEQNFQKKSGRKLRSGLISRQEYDEMLKRVCITSDTAMLRDCNFIIEAIWEDKKNKQQLFAKLDGLLPPDAIITTNTSSIPISELIPSDNRKKFFAGLHFFYPIELRDIAEINTHADTDPAVTRKIKEFLMSIGRRAILLDERNNFLLNRLLLPMQNEAYKIIQEGKLSIPELDALARSRLLPVGIFEFFDQVGIDVMNASIRNYAEAYPDGSDYSALIACLASLAEKGKLGVKRGEGFYQYPLATDTIVIGTDKLAASTDLIKRLSNAFFQPMVKARSEKFMSPEELDHAIREYWGFETSVFDMAKKAGYDF